MSERSCPISGAIGERCPAGEAPAHGQRRSNSRLGPRGCSFSGYSQPGDLHAAFDVPQGLDVNGWLRSRERTSINQVLYSDLPSAAEVDAIQDRQELDGLCAKEQDLLAVALGPPARQVMIRAQEIGPRTGWRDGYLSTEHGFCPPDYDESAGALARSAGRVWSDLCERMPGCVARGCVRESIAALPTVQGTEDVVPDRALWASVVALGMLCSIYRYEENHHGEDGVRIARQARRTSRCDLAYDLGEELLGIPRSIALPYFQISRRLGRTLPHLSFPDQASYNIKIRDPTSTHPYVARFDNTELRWSMFGERAEVAFLKGCADTSASFQHGPDAIAACQEHVMNRNTEGLLRELIRLKEILELMPNAFHSINTNPNSGENYVSGAHWVRWGHFSAPLSKRCPAASGLQFPPYLVMDAFLGRRQYDSFLGAEGVHLRAWLPTNQRAFIAAIEYHYRIPEFVEQTGDPRLMGALDGIVEAYTGERGFMGAHRYKVFGILEVAAQTGRAVTNGLSGAGGARPWEETHKQFSEAMKERLEPYRGKLLVEPHEMRGTFQECRYVSRILRRSFVDEDPTRSIALVTLDLRDTGITYAPGDRLAVMPLNDWGEIAKVAAALGLEEQLGRQVAVRGSWARFEQHLSSVRRTGVATRLTVLDILRRGHLAPITKDLALKIHAQLSASSNAVLRVLATSEWPVRGSLGDLLQAAVLDTPASVWEKAFDLNDGLSWLPDLMPPEVPRTYSIASYSHELLPSTVDLAVSRAEYKLCADYATTSDVDRAGVSSGFLNPRPDGDGMNADDEVLIGISRPIAFQLPLDPVAPCAFFAGGSGVAPFRSFWQSRLATSGRNILYLGVQSREKFCFEEELREYVAAGLIEVHTAFSRDSRGLVCEANELVERHIPPRYIDALIVEQGTTVCDLVMSKKQGGLGGHLYICGSVAVFDSVMKGIRKAIYSHRTATMDSVDIIVNKAFAERRIMLDVFMTPKPLPCNLPAIPLSQLALHTGHRPGTRTWIGVHGSAYDVTEFLPMHPGGTLIIKSNAGVDCSKTFDNLAHTNNPEVSSLLTKYFVGHLSRKPDYGNDEISALYDLWADYLRTTVEILVAHQFEMHEIQGATIHSASAHDPSGTSNIWRRETLPNVMAVRVFYDYQSRLLQGGFTALFGPKMQELVLKLAFHVASASSSGSTNAGMPDVLGGVARAKTSHDAVACTKEIALVGQFVCDADASLRFQERGVLAFATRSVELDMALLEGLREEACTGMDAFDGLTGVLGESSDEDLGTARLTIVAAFLLQILERMARRLEVFYAELAQCSVYQPELERNPARTRWAVIRRRVKDGSFFVLTHASDVVPGPGASGYYASQVNSRGHIDFERVMAQVKRSLEDASARHQGGGPAPVTLSEVHRARDQSQSVTVAGRDNGGALGALSMFMERNSRAIRRLSRLPPVATLEAEWPPTREGPHGSLGAASAELTLGMMDRLRVGAAPPTPPTSRESSRSPTSLPPRSARLIPSAGLNRPRQAASHTRRTGPGATPMSLYPVVHGGGTPPTPPLDAHAALQAMAAKLPLNTRARSLSAVSTASHYPPPRSTMARSPEAALGSVTASRGRSPMSAAAAAAATAGTSTLRAFRLRSATEARELSQVPPTF